MSLAHVPVRKLLANPSCIHCIIAYVINMNYGYAPPRLFMHDPQILLLRRTARGSHACNCFGSLRHETCIIGGEPVNFRCSKDNCSIAEIFLENCWSFLQIILCRHVFLNIVCCYGAWWYGKDKEYVNILDGVRGATTFTQQRKLIVLKWKKMSSQTY